MVGFILITRKMWNFIHFHWICYQNTFEYTIYWNYCADDGTDIYRTKKGNSSGSESGEMVLNKVEE